MVIVKSQENVYVEISDNEAKDKILNLLINNPGTFYKSSVLAKQCGFPRKGTNEEVRHAITELIILGKHPIVSNAYGYSYPKTSTMIKYGIEHLDHNVQGIQRRIDALTMQYWIWKNKENGNKRLQN